MTLSVILDPSEADLAPIEASAPANPFCCARYAAARRANGATVVLFAESVGDERCAAAIGYLRGRAIGRTLEITSAPAVPADCLFWDGVLDFCRQHHVAELEVDSYGSRDVALPERLSPSSFRERTEWVLQLHDGDTPAFASNHRRNIKKAQKFGVGTACTTDETAVDAHVRLMNASMARRSARGEIVPSATGCHTSYERALLASGAARLYQATHQGEVVSSLLVLTSSRGAYYQSAGTSPEGMEIGASTLLVSEAMRNLASDGKTVFNLGGAGPESEGLRRFKAGFGAEPVTLTAAAYQVASPMHRKLRTALNLIRRPDKLRASITQLLAGFLVVITSWNRS